MATAKPKINNQITATPVRLIGSDGTNYGVVEISRAFEIAKEQELDLIEISPTAKPPVVKIMNYDKWRYQEEKRERDARKNTKEVEIRGVRISLGTSEHDLEMKAKKVGEFLETGDKVRIELILRGRAKYLDQKFINERLERILHFLPVEYKTISGPSKGPRGIAITIEKK